MAHPKTCGWEVLVMGHQLRSGLQGPCLPATCTSSANRGHAEGPGVEAKTNWGKRLDVRWFHGVLLFFTPSSTLLWSGAGVWRQCAHSPGGIRERQTYKHQKNSTGTVMRHEEEVNSEQNVHLWSQGGAKRYLWTTSTCWVFLRHSSHTPYTEDLPGIEKTFPFIYSSQHLHRAKRSYDSQVRGRREATCPRLRSRKEAERRFERSAFPRTPAPSSSLPFWLLPCGSKIPCAPTPAHTLFDS